MRFWLQQWEQFPVRREGLWEQICDLVQNCARIFTVFMQRRDDAFSPRYNPVLWTIKADMRASLALSVTHYIAAYPTWKLKKASMFTIFHTITPGLVVPPRTWHSIGAVLILYSLFYVPLARRICENSIAQFFGTHSFAIHLVHFCLVISFGPDLFSRVWSLTGYKDLQSLAIGFEMTYVILFIGVLLTAAIFYNHAMAMKCDFLAHAASKHSITYFVLQRHGHVMERAC